MKKYIIIIGLSLGMIFTASAKRIYVSMYGDGNGDGSSWANAMSWIDLEHEINTSTDNGDEIWMKQGFYSAIKLWYDPSNPIYWKGNSLKFYGGFAGTEISPIQRQLDVYETVLVGGIGSPSIWIETGSKCTFNGFVLMGGEHEGGAIRLIYNSSEFVNIKIRNIENNYSNGGAIFMEGRIGAPLAESPKLVNVLICDNELENAIYVGSISLELRNVTITNNFGGTLLSVSGWDAFVEIHNSIIWGNSDDNIYLHNTNPTNSVCSYSLLGSPFLGRDEGGNIIDDPNFTTGYRLLPDSPCRNTGNSNEYPRNFSLLDLDNKARIVDTIIDMGAYECR